MEKQLQTITGRLGKNPVLYMRNTKKGRVPVAKFSLACEVFKDRKSSVIWFQISAWDKRAELCAKNLRKGDSVQLHGFASKESFDGKNGKVEYNHFNAVFITFLGKAKANLNTNQAVAAVTTTQPAQPALPGVTTDPF